MKRRLSTLITSILIIFIVVQIEDLKLAEGGECVPSSVGHSFYKADDVFVGQVISKNNSTSLPATATLAIDEVFTGSHNKTMTVSDVELDDTGHQHALFSMVKKYLVFASNSSDSILSASGCFSYTHEITDSFEKERSELKKLAIIDASNNISPNKQMKLGIDPEDVKCKNGFFLAIRNTVDGLSPACLKHETWLKMVNDRSWRPIA